jgi:hypothetical protein
MHRYLPCGDRSSGTAEGYVLYPLGGASAEATPHQRQEAIKRRDQGEETLADIGRSYNVSAATISRLIIK